MMDTLLKKYTRKIKGVFPPDERLRFKVEETEGLFLEKLLLEFLLEYIELREERKNKKEK